MNAPGLIVRRFSRLDYHRAWAAMRAAVAARSASSDDEIWFLEHPPVFTLGQAGRREHVLDPGDIPVVASDRGGQVTYHGPGQLVVYVLVDLKRRGLGVKRLVWALEQSVIDLVQTHGVHAARRPRAPGVYVGEKKLAAIGLRVRHGVSYHGLALNVDGDLAPFARIEPCGFPGLEATRLSDLNLDWTVGAAAERLLPHVAARLGVPTAAVREAPASPASWDLDAPPAGAAHGAAGAGR